MLFLVDSVNFTVVLDIGLTDIGLSSVGIGLIRYRIKIPLVRQIFMRYRTMLCRYQILATNFFDIAPTYASTTETMASEGEKMILVFIYVLSPFSDISVSPDFCNIYFPVDFFFARRGLYNTLGDRKLNYPFYLPIGKILRSIPPINYSGSIVFALQLYFLGEKKYK
jgi:hypothetical protein